MCNNTTNACDDDDDDDDDGNANGNDDTEQVLSAVASIVANIFFGYSKDKTSSYNDDITFLVGLCFFGLALTIFLLFWDARHGQPVLNRVKWGRAPADTKSVGIVDPPLCASANGDSSTTIA